MNARVVNGDELRRQQVNVRRVMHHDVLELTELRDAFAVKLVAE
ncbi:hypothetical protein [Symbiopectobacterium purcellii]